MTVAETLQSGAAAVSDKARTALDTAGNALGTARDSAGNALETARETAGNALETARDASGKAIATTTHAAQDFAERAVAVIEANPLSVLVGGLAVGMLTGSLLPRTDREAQVLAPIGRRLSLTARGAVDAAKDTARSELDGLGLSRSSAKDQIGKLIGGVITAMTAAGTAAVSAKTGDSQSATASAPAPAAQQPTTKTGSTAN